MLLPLTWMQSTHNTKTGQELCIAVNECLTVAVFALLASGPAVCTEYICCVICGDYKSNRSLSQARIVIAFAGCVVADTHVFPASR